MKTLDWFAIVRKNSAAAAVALLLSGTAGARESGPMFVIVRNLPTTEFVSRVQAGCMQKGMSVEIPAPNQVLCSMPMDDSMKSLFIRALATPSYSTNPVYKYRFTASEIGDQTTVSIDPFVQYANAYGQVTTIPISNKKERAEIRNQLDAMKVNWESRTQTPQAPATTSQPATSYNTGAGLRAATPPVAEPTPPLAVSHPSAAAAKQALGQAQCFDNFRLVGESAGNAIFEATCRGGSTSLVTCRGGSCRPLQ